MTVSDATAGAPRPSRAADPRPDLIGLVPEEATEALARHFKARRVGGYRVGQALAWLYEKGATTFDEMTDLPAAERAALAAAFRISSPEAARVERSTDGTVKHLWRMADGELVESVLIPAQDRLTLCISSQAGCAMACVFCATGWSGYRRQLEAGEIVAQYRGALRYAGEHGMGPISNIVFMGMGEPLMNPKGVFPALSVLNHGLGFGARRITVSTVGVVPGIEELTRRPEQFRLAVSLHAPTPELRAELIPLEKKYALPELLAALRGFESAGGRRITFEYVMIDGLNDADEHARKLAGLVREFPAHVNLIPYNPIPGPEWKPSPQERIRRFAAILEERGIPATVREPRGTDIAAACGQLRAEHATAPPKPYLSLVGLEGRRSGVAGR